MLFCCSRELKPFNVFYAACENCVYKKIEYRICPHCKTPIYQETIKRFDNTETTPKPLKGEKAVKAFKRALLNRLTFFEKLKQGSRQNQNWYYGDFKRTNKKDKNGNIVELQIKKNFNNETVAILGEAKVHYLFEGKREISAGTVDYTNGEDIRPISSNTNRQTSMKLEAPCFS